MTYLDENGNVRKPTRQEALNAAGQVLATMRATVARMTPREQAEAAWTPTYAGTVDDLEDEIRKQRGLPPKRREGNETN